ncbi:MAG: cadherin-like domain-containing protein [Arcobacteraceae bacterium]|nr:cadherin-like domain-containing protein [Arcobacteraceae bacterium]
MADVIGKVEGLEGKFFVKDPQGNIRELQNGDEVYEGDTIVPDTNNPTTATVTIAPNNGTPPLKINSAQEQMLDKTLLNEGLNNQELAFNPETVQDALVLNNQNPQNDEPQTAQFAALDGAQTDVNSDLRQRAFGVEENQNPDNNNEATQGQFTTLDGSRTDVNSDLRQRQFGGNDSDYTQDNGADQAATFTALDGARTDVNSDLRDANWPGIMEYTQIQGNEADGTIIGSEGGATFASRDGDSTDIVSDLRQAQWFEPVEEPTYNGDVDIDNGTPDTVIPPVNNITVKLVSTDINGDIIPEASIAEGETAYYKAILVDSKGNQIVGATGDVDITFTDGTAIRTGISVDGESDFTGTNATVAINTVFSAVASDDAIGDNGEKFNVQITDDSYTNPSSYQNLIHDTTPVVTTITDDTGTPNIPNDGVEADHESVKIRLIALDANGDPILSGGNYTFTNSVAEGDAAQYKALAFDSSNTTFANGSELNKQLGSVTISSANTTATAGSDYTATSTTVALDTAFSVNTLDDYIADNNEDFTVNIGSYVTPTTGNSYENVDASGSVTTTITDGVNDAIPNQDVDTVYLELSGDDIQGEINGEKLTHTINLVDKDGNAVNLANGKSITISLTYSDIAGKDAVEGADLTGGKTISFILNGNGGSSYNFENVIVGGDADFELSESYNVVIGAITNQADTGFENVAISTTQNSANGTIVEGVVVEGGNVINGTSQELVQGLGAFNTITSFTYKDENGDTQTGTVGNPTDTQFGTITIEANGDWSYTSDATEDHSNGTLLDTITYTVTDGGTDTQHEFPILVTDTVPVAIDDNATTPREVTENAGAIIGNVITNTDDDGADTPSADIIGTNDVNVTTFTYKDTNGDNATANAGTTVTEQNGTLTVNQDGSWTYTPNQSVDNSSGAVSANFDYTITDSDGDTSSATQYINILDDDADIPTINNANNTPIKLYEGDSKVTFNGTDNYNESSSNANKDTSSASTHKLDFTTGTDDAGITSFTFDGTPSAQIAVGGSATVTDDDKGILTVHYDGTWEYTPPAFYIHPDANGINNFQTTFTYTVTDIDGDAVATGNQTIQVDDTLATFGTAPSDVSIDEAYLPSGTAPDNTKLTKTEAINIDVSKLSGAHDVTFLDAGSQNDATLNNVALSSLGSDISHEVTNSGHTLILKDANGDAVLTVTINNPTSDTPTYTAVLSQAFDHETALLENGNLEFDFNISLNDDDNDPANETFKVSIIDDVSPDSQTMTVDEDSSDTTITTNADVTQANTSITSDGIYGTGSITADGKFKYVPDTNFSGEDSVTYRTTLDDGTTKDVTVTITVNPIVDAPTVNVNDVSAIEDATDNADVGTGNTKEGTNSIELGLILPSLSADQTDQNNATTGDHAERNGYIELKFTNGTSVSGAVLEKADGTDLATINSDNQTVKVYISDLGSDYHHNDLNPGADGAIQLTQAEYEALKIIHAQDNDTDIDINIKTTSYEVDDSNIPLVGISGVSDNDNMTVTIAPVTDDISLIWDSATGGTISQTTIANDTFTFDAILEGSSSINLKDILSKTSGFESDGSGDLDGSEQRTYTIEGIPEGTIVTLGGQSITADSNGKAIINLNDANEKLDDHDFTLEFPEFYAGTIANAKITLSVKDIGADGENSGVIKTAEVYFNMTVTGVSNGIEALNAAQATGLEDAGRANGNTTNDGAAGDITAPENGIDLNITATTVDTSGREKVIMMIDKVPDGGAIYYSDANGTITIDENGAVAGLTNTNANVTVDATANGTFKVTIVDFKNDADLKFVPPHNSNDDYTFDVTAKTQDGNSLASNTTDIKTINVGVTGVADIPVKDDFKTLDSDGNDNSNAATDIYSAVTVEDTDTDSTTAHNGAVVSFENLYKEAGLSSYDSDSSEGLSVVITALGNDFSVVAKDGGELSASGISFNGLSGTSREWSFDVSDLSKVEILTSKNYSGSIEFTVKHITTENDGNSKTDEKDLKVLVKPVAEGTITTSSDVTEDVASLVDFSIVQQNGESGETLDAVWINKADITNKDFTLYTDAGTTQLADNGTTIIDDGTYYKLTGAAINSIYIKYDLNVGTSDTTDNSFGIKYEVSDSFTANSETFTDTKTINSGVYSIPLLSVTDIITLDTSAGAVATVGDIVYADGAPSVTINEVGTFSLDLDVTSTDTDNSENFTRFVIENVQRGITIDDPYATMAISGGDTNIWFLDIPDQELTGGTSSYTVNFNVNDSLRYYADTSTVKITAYAKDSGSNADDIQEAVQTIEFINNIVDPVGPGINPTIDVDMNINDIVVTEDTPFTLDGIIETLLPSNATNDAIADSASVTYTLAFSNLTHVSFDKENDTYTDTHVNSYNGEHYITVTASKSAIQSTIETVLSNIKMIADENYNVNNAGSQLSFGVKLTAYVGEGWARDTTDVKTLDVDVVPVTDDITSNVNQTHVDENSGVVGSAQEDGTTTINITLDSVDKDSLPGGNPVYNIVKAADDSTDADTVSITYKSGIYGTLTWSGGSYTFGSGNTVANVPVADISNNNLKFTPEQDASGNVTFTYTIFAKETGADNISETSKDFTINVAAVADGLNLPQLKGQGDEDTFIQIYSDFSNTTPLDGATQIDDDGSESILSMYIDNVPDDFLIYIGEEESQILANKGSTDGNVDLGAGSINTYQWSINISGGIPKVWLKAPENWSSTTPIDLILRTVVKDGSDTTIVTKDFQVTIDSVADGFDSVTGNNTTQTASVDIPINLNANAGDIDGSETGILTLSGFGAADVTFKQDGADIMANVSYDNGTDTYTISNIDLAVDKLNELTFQKAGLHGQSIDYTFKTVEGDNNTKISSIESGSFTATTDNVITDTTIAGTDGQDDRLMLSVGGIDFSSITSTSIEKIDLTNTDTDITNVTMQDVIDATDGDNELIIIADDSNDSVELKNDGGNTWSQGANITYGDQTFETYTNGDATVKISVDENSASIVTIA